MTYVATSSLTLSSEIVSSDVFGLFFDTLAWGIMVGVVWGLLWVAIRPLFRKGR